MLSQLSRQLAVVLVDERLRTSNDQRLVRSTRPIRRQPADVEATGRLQRRTRPALDPHAVSTEL